MRVRALSSQGQHLISSCVEKSCLESLKQISEHTGVGRLKHELGWIPLRAFLRPGRRTNGPGRASPGKSVQGTLCMNVVASNITDLLEGEGEAPSACQLEWYKATSAWARPASRGGSAKLRACSLSGAIARRSVLGRPPSNPWNGTEEQDL